MAKWADQLNPHDLCDYDEINESLVLDLPIDGQTRKVLVHVARNGHMYVLDRTTGEILSADPYDTVNATNGIDLKTGRPNENEALKPVIGKTIVGVCPAAPGAKDWQPTPYSTRTKLIYVPHQHLCMNWKSSEVGYFAGTPFVGATVDMYAGPGGKRGEYMAWDPVARKKVWAISENFPVWSGTLVTGGDVAFYGTMDRWFKAVDATAARSSGNSRHHPESSASRSPLWAMTGFSTSPFCPASAGARGGGQCPGRPAGSQRRARLHRGDPRPSPAYGRRRHAFGVCRAEHATGGATQSGCTAAAQRTAALRIRCRAAAELS
jgi:glucose dehydrogenase